MNIETSITISIHPDEDYHFEVHAGDVIKVEYIEHSQINNGAERRFDIAFGSLEEMEAVAKAMLRVVAQSR